MAKNWLSVQTVNSRLTVYISHLGPGGKVRQYRPGEMSITRLNSVMVDLAGKCAVTFGMDVDGLDHLTIHLQIPASI